MFNLAKKPKVQTVTSYPNELISPQAKPIEPIELTAKEISSMMQFGNYYSGCSPEWELFQ
jgi:hypothetical protein